MTGYTIKPLGPDTWDDFAQLIEWRTGIFPLSSIG